MDHFSICSSCILLSCICRLYLLANPHNTGISVYQIIHSCLHKRAKIPAMPDAMQSLVCDTHSAKAGGREGGGALVQ